jgi:hypothetical protein
MQHLYAKSVVQSAAFWIRLGRTAAARRAANVRRPRERHRNRRRSWSFGERGCTGLGKGDGWVPRLIFADSHQRVHGFPGFPGTGVTLTNAVSGSTTSSLSLAQSATGGAGGPGESGVNPPGFSGGPGGDATSALTRWRERQLQRECRWWCRWTGFWGPARHSGLL